SNHIVELGYPRQEIRDERRFGQHMPIEVRVLVNPIPEVIARNAEGICSRQARQRRPSLEAIPGACALGVARAIPDLVDDYRFGRSETVRIGRESANEILRAP